ncbi:hypothetical protein [Sphingomonas sp.]|uniref:hypothetical protein n=1 Tax=Sphingomonas sp. TaxID=28214 RepID=UPI0031D92EF2
MLRSILGWAALSLAVPALGAERTDSKAAAAAANRAVSKPEAIHAEMIEFGKWIMQLDEATAPAIAVFREFGPSWNAAMRTRSPDEAEASIRPVLARLDEAVRTARARLEALDTPDFPRLALIADVRPVALRSEMQRMMGNIADVTATIPGILAAMRKRDPRAAEQAVIKLLDSARALYRAQSAMTGAWAATAEVEDPAYHAFQFELLFFKSGVRLLDCAERLTLRKPDPALAGELRAIAGEVDKVIAAGHQRLDAQRSEFTNVAAELAGKKDADSVSARAMADKVLAVSGLQQESFAVSQRYASQLRRTADTLDKAPASLATLQPMLDSLRGTRVELDAISIRVAEVMAGAR